MEIGVNYQTTDLSLLLGGFRMFIIFLIDFFLRLFGVVASVVTLFNIIYSKSFDPCSSGGEQLFLYNYWAV